MKIHRTLSFIFISVFLTGCWDNIQIEERGFIVGSAIDLNDNKDEILVTNQFVIAANLANPSQQGQSGKPYLNISLPGNSVFTINQAMARHISQVPSYDHLYLLLISKDVAEKKFLFSDTLDSYLRNPSVNRGLKVLITENTSKKLLDITPVENKIPAIHINELLDQNIKHGGFIQQKAIGDVDEDLLIGKSFVLPYIQNADEIKITQGAVFNGQKDQMVGVLNADEMTGLELINAKSKNKVIEVTYNEFPLAVEVSDVVSKLSVDTKDVNHLKVDVTLIVKGILRETNGFTNFFETNTLQSIEEVLSEEFKKYMQMAVSKSQGELNTDVFKLHTILETRYYETWLQVKDDWDFGEDYYSMVTFNFDVDTDIISIGSTNRTDKKHRGDK